MKELNSQEMEMVSAAGLISNLTGSVFKLFGGVIDAGTSLFGLKTDAQSVGAKMGTGVGHIVEFDFVKGFTEIACGIYGAIELSIDAVNQIKAKQSA
ncbi:hypothetical protein [Leclercia sp.]|uniref:hypothetical protein n=1 Tax=Leclercia sp. TaxID=1898428 RepID=UPI002FDCB813